MVVRVEGVDQLVNRERRVGVHVPVAFLVGLPRRQHQAGWVGNLGHQAVNGRRLFGWVGAHDQSAPYDTSKSSTVGSCFSLTLASGTSVRTSKIEIIGSSRTNRNISVVK